MSDKFYLKMDTITKILQESKRVSEVKKAAIGLYNELVKSQKLCSAYMSINESLHKEIKELSGKLRAVEERNKLLMKN